MRKEAILARFSPTWLGRRIECLGEVSSTNDVARDLLEACGPEAHGAVILADGQSAGRGRLGRAWVFPPGKALALSVALWPEPPGPGRPAEGLPLLTLAGALAVRGALETACDLRSRLKWPNDVLAGGRKIAGVLLEGRWLGEAPGGLVLGIGVNLLQAEQEFPPEIRETATSVLAQTGKAVEREAFAAALLAELEPLLETGLAQPGELAALAAPLWAHEQDDPLEVRWEGGVETGRFAGVGVDGALLLNTAGGPRRILFGEVRSSRRNP